MLEGGCEYKAMKIFIYSKKNFKAILNDGFLVEKTLSRQFLPLWSGFEHESL